MPRDPQVQPTSSFLDALRNPADDLRQKYLGKPVELAERFGVMLPRNPRENMKEQGFYDFEKHGEIYPGMRELVIEVCSGLVEDAAAVGPRGGGKSKGVSFIEFYLVFIMMFDALNLGGSELQADNVYQYLLGYLSADPFWRDQVKGESLRSLTETIHKAWIRVLTASQKSVRSPHAGGIKPDGRHAGGLLVIDEEAEADADIVEASLPTINTARPSVNVRCSTFHNATGSFADLIENHEEMGYKLYRWTIFDICEPCECTPGICESTEKCFREDHIDKFLNPDTGEEEERLVHKAYCGGVARFAEGWLPMNEILKLWRRFKRNHNKFEVEAMGSRPSTAGFVIKDRGKHEENTVSLTGAQLYAPGGTVEVCVDWGVGVAGIEVWQEQVLGRHALLEAFQLEEAGQSQIISEIIRLVRKYPECDVIAADIGGGGNYLNKSLVEEHGMNVRDVNFQTEKEAAAAAWNIYNEAGKLLLPEEHTDFHRQAKKWKRKNGRIEKGDDHLCDTAVCYFARFIEELGLDHIRVPPATMNTAPPDRRVGSLPTEEELRNPMPGSERMAMAVALGGRRRQK